MRKKRDEDEKERRWEREREDMGRRLAEANRRQVEWEQERKDKQRINNEKAYDVWGARYKTYTASSEDGPLILMQFFCMWI